MIQGSPLNLLLRIVVCYELWPVTNCRLLRIVVYYELTPQGSQYLAKILVPDYNTLAYR